MKRRQRLGCGSVNMGLRVASGGGRAGFATLLGLRADAPRKRLTIAPLKTSLFKHVEVTGLHFAGHRLDFAVDGDRVTMGNVPRGIKVAT